MRAAAGFPLDTHSAASGSDVVAGFRRQPIKFRQMAPTVAAKRRMQGRYG